MSASTNKTAESHFSKLKRAYAALDAGRAGEALVLSREILRDRPRDKEMRLGLGTLFYKLERYTEALAILEPMLVEYPDDYAVKNNLPWLYATAGDPAVRNGQKAISLAQEALLIQPDNYHIWSTLSEACYVAGAYERATRLALEA